MGLFDSPHEWRVLGGSFQLQPFQPTASYFGGASFRQLKRALGVPCSHIAPTFDEWHYGRRNGTEVLLLNHTEGSGSSSTTYTVPVARIDPPLFLGLGIERKPFLEIFGPKDFIPTGHPNVDPHIRINGFEAQRVLSFLALETPEGMDVITRVVANASELRITDSCVAFFGSGYELDPNKIRWQLDTVVYLASMLARRRRAFPSTPAEDAQRAIWQDFTTEAGFAFDRERMTLFGQYQGTHIKIALETESLRLRTSVNVRFPQTLPLGFTVTRTRTPDFLQGLFSQDIIVGDPIFDEMYKVTGHPEPYVRAALAKPALLDALKRLGAAAAEVHLNHAQLYFRVEGPTADKRQLQAMCETGRIASNALLPPLREIGPYR